MVTFVHYHVFLFMDCFFVHISFDSTFSHNLFARNTHRNPLTIFKERKRAQLPKKKLAAEKKTYTFFEAKRIVCSFFPKQPRGVKLT